ncbi:MAG TPA: redoxin domain-containing protein [Planctomycetota bacterium]|jgi:peroxiredoxin|nr:redoxin domain-containing protein [Planctomycetota bacterium]
MKWLGLVMIAALPALALAGGQGKDKKGDQPKPADPKPADVKPTEAKLEIGKAAPAFELKDLDGKAVKLADYKGKIVVLEWFNPECPFVVRQHSEGPLKDAAAKATKDGVVWLAINSSGPGKEGNGVEKNKKAVADWKMAYPVLVDEDGTVGMAYGSKNTPTMYIIDAKGMLAYHGAIDNAADGKPEGGTLVNYVESALAEMKAGKAVSKAETKPYGCGVKYAKPKS